MTGTLKIRYMGDDGNLVEKIIEDNEKSTGDGHRQCLTGILSSSLPNINRATQLGLMLNQQNTQINLQDQLYLRQLIDAERQHQINTSGLGYNQQAIAQTLAQQNLQQYVSANRLNATLPTARTVIVDPVVSSDTKITEKPEEIYIMGVTRSMCK